MNRRASKFDVIVVGAGAAGVGIGVAMLHAGIKNFTLIDRYQVGASFERWPAEMRFITPSFPTNSIGMLDLNAVAIGTSPAHSLKVEHPTGREFAAYLQAVAAHFQLPIKTACNVRSLAGHAGDWRLETSAGELRSRFLIWAAGEFQYPRLAPFPGAELCQHNSRVRSWNSLSGEEAIVIGGYESGVDAAIHLARNGKRVTVLDRAATWHSANLPIRASRFRRTRSNGYEQQMLRNESGWRAVPM